MTASVVAQMRFVACGDAMRDRGWAQYLCRRHHRLLAYFATMYPLFNGWVGLLKILDSAGKLTITADGCLTDTVIGSKAFGGFQVIKMIT